MRVHLYAAASLLGLTLGCHPQAPVNVRPDFDSASLDLKVVLIDDPQPPIVPVPQPPPSFTPDEERFNCPQFPVATYWMRGNWHWNGAAWVWARGYCYRGEDPAGTTGGPYLLYSKDLQDIKLVYKKSVYSGGRFRRAFWRQETRLAPLQLPQAPPPPVQTPPPRDTPPAAQDGASAPAPAPAQAAPPAAPPTSN